MDMFLIGQVNSVFAVISSNSLRRFLGPFYSSLNATGKVTVNKTEISSSCLDLQLGMYVLILKFRFSGRAIRHRGDYATILLLDQRYGSARIQRNLPGWISNRLQHQARFGSAFAAIRKVNCWGGVGATSPQSF